jgi:hypothetical protein
MTSPSSPDRSPSRSTGRTGDTVGALVWVVATTAVTTALYLLTLGWHAIEDLTPADCTGQYAPWQVVALGLGLAAWVGLATWRQHPAVGVATSALTTTVLFAADAVTATDPCGGASLWPIGAAFLLVGATAGLTVVAALVHTRRERVSAR